MSSPRSLPFRPDLEHLKSQAEVLSRAVASGDPAALDRVRALPRPGRSPAGAHARLPLSLALLVIAREYGFARWPALKHAVNTRRARDQEDAMQYFTLDLSKTADAAPRNPAEGDAPAAGLDAGSAASKFVALDRAASGYRLAAAGWMDRQAGESLADALRRFAAGHGIATTPVVLALSGQAVSLRPVDVDPATADQLSRADANTVEQYLPVATNESVVASQPLDTTGLPADRRRLMLAAGRADAAAALRGAAREAGLACRIVDADGLALANMFALNYGSDPAWQVPACLLNLGAAYVTVELFTGGRLSFSRIMPLTGESIVQSPALLVAEVKRCLDFHATAIDPAPFQKGLLAGGFAATPRLPAALSEGLELPFELADPFRAVTIPAGGPAIPGRREAYGVAVGLALRRFV